MDKIRFQTPLIWAVREGNREIIEVLIAKGANVNARDKGKHLSTPLIHASIIGSEEIAELLIAKGADINLRD